MPAETSVVQHTCLAWRDTLDSLNSLPIKRELDCPCCTEMGTSQPDGACWTKRPHPKGVAHAPTGSTALCSQPQSTAFCQSTTFYQSTMHSQLQSTSFYQSTSFPHSTALNCTGTLPGVVECGWLQLTSSTGKIATNPLGMQVNCTQPHLTAVDCGWYAYDMPMVQSTGGMQLTGWMQLTGRKWLTAVDCGWQVECSWIWLTWEKAEWKLWGITEKSRKETLMFNQN